MQNLDIKNGFYKLSREDQAKYESLLNELNVSRFWKMSITDIRKITVPFQMIKAKAMARVTRETLNKVTYDNEGRKFTPKVILVVSFVDVLKFLLEDLKEFNPLQDDNVNKFNEPNENNRLIIILLRCQGFTLHDTTGLFPRYMYIMSNYSANKSIQAMSRVTRADAVGKATIRFFYGISESNEKLILKTKVSIIEKPLDFEDECEDISLVDLCLDYIIKNNIKMVNVPDDLIEKLKLKIM